MERLTCYESILYQLLVFNYATKKSLLLLNFSKMPSIVLLNAGWKNEPSVMGE